MIYLVKVRIEPRSTEEPNVNFKHIAFQGTFVPKAKRTSREKIEEQCKAFLLKNLKRDHSELKFNFKNFKIETYKNDFTLVEDKAEDIPKKGDTNE